MPQPELLAGLGDVIQRAANACRDLVKLGPRDDQWRFHCAIHNLLKLHRAGGLDLIGERNEQNSNPASLAVGERRGLATLATAGRSLAGRFQRSLATISADGFTCIEPIAVTDTRS